MRLARIACAILIVVPVGLSLPLFAQTPAKVAFEVASIKPLPPMDKLAQEVVSGKRSYPAFGTTINGSRLTMGFTSMTSLIMLAYGIEKYQISGPDWMGSQYFELNAKLPEGASKDDVPKMLQTLLAERFKLSAHREKREQTVYALLVSKEGLNLKEALSDAEVEASAKENATKDEKQIATPFGKINRPKTQDRRVSSQTAENGNRIVEFFRTDMAELASSLTQYLDRPVMNMTELKGSYRLTYEISRDEQMNMVRNAAPMWPSGATTGAFSAATGVPPGIGGSGSEPSIGGIFPSIKKLGLKLDSQKAPVETLVIDHVEKIPTED